MLSFGEFELQVRLSCWLCFNTQMKAFYFSTFLLFGLVKDHCTCLTAEHIFWSPSQSPHVLHLCRSLHWTTWFQSCKSWLGISQAPFLKQISKAVSKSSVLRSYYCLMKNVTKQRQVCLWVSSLLLFYCKYLLENKMLCSGKTIYFSMYSPTKIQVVSVS